MRDHAVADAFMAIFGFRRVKPARAKMKAKATLKKSAAPIKKGNRPRYPMQPDPTLPDEITDDDR